MNSKDTVLNKMIKSTIHAIETKRPIIFLKTASVEMVHRVINSEEFSALCPELTQSLDGWVPVSSDHTIAMRMKLRNEQLSNYCFLYRAAAGKAIDRLIKNAMTPERIEPPYVMIVKADYSDYGKSDKLWDDLIPFINFYTADELRETPIGRSQIILYGSAVNIPDDFTPHTFVVEEEYPEREELADLVDQYLNHSDDVNDIEVKTTLTDRLKGLTRIHVERLLSYIKNHRMSPKEIYQFVQSEKVQFLKKSNLLELIEPNDKECSGMEKFGRMIKELKPLLGNAEQIKMDIATDSPKGILLCGVPGTGKSVAANMFARETGLPMIKMDIGRLMGGLVGESEHNMQSALKLADALAPCIVFIDELDKGFEGAKAKSQSNGSDTTFRRMFASLLSWMQEHEKPCFIFATANDISNLPKEFFRSGRFDCLYSVQMPRREECKQILIHHLKKHNQNGLLGFDPEKNADALMTSFEKKGKLLRGPRFVTGADIEKIVEFTARSFWRQQKRVRISYDDWEEEFRNVLDTTSVYGDGIEQRNSIALCYIRMLRNNFESISDTPLLTSRDYVVTTVDQEKRAVAALPNYSVTLPTASFKDVRFDPNITDKNQAEEKDRTGEKAEPPTKVFDNEYDFELYKVIAQRMVQLAPSFECNALNEML